MPIFTRFRRSMKLSNPFRRVFSQPTVFSPTPPPPEEKLAPHLSQQQHVTLQHAYLSTLSNRLSAFWKAYDTCDDRMAIKKIRHLHLELANALEQYYNLLTVRDTSGVRKVLDNLEITMKRLQTLDQVINLEVDRFENASLDIDSRFIAAINPHAKLAVCIDANDVLIELEQYRKYWACMMHIYMIARLEHAHQVLRDIVNHQKRSPISISDPLETHKRVRPQPRSLHRPNHNPTTKRRKQPSPNHPSSSESGDDGPMKRVKSRTATLKDMAANYRSLSHKSTSTSPPSSEPKSSPMQSVQPRLSVTRDQGSFASNLYRTRNIRRGDISDQGVKLERSNVRGDGRCLFRALSRTLYHRKYKKLPSERTEREDADRLRQRAVNELIKRRELIDRHFVIEGDFERYTQQMSLSKTYGGEPELLMLAKLLHLPIVAYIHHDNLYRQMQIYGRQYRGNPLRILYSDEIHYDALLAS